MKIYTNSRLFWEIHSKPENSKKHKNNKCKFKQIVKRIHSCQLLTDFLTPSLLPKKTPFDFNFWVCWPQTQLKEVRAHGQNANRSIWISRKLFRIENIPIFWAKPQGYHETKIIGDRRLFSIKSKYSSFSGLILTWRIVQMLSILSLRAFCSRRYLFSFHKSPHQRKFVLSGKRYLRSSFLYHF